MIQEREPVGGAGDLGMDSVMELNTILKLKQK